MSNCRTLAIAASILLLFSCGTPKVEKHIPELLDFVPSDALVVASYDKVCDAVELLDTSSILRKIDYGQLKGSKAVLSVCYTSSLIPILAIDTGKAAQDTSKAVMDILEQAVIEGIRAEYIHGEDNGGRRGALVITSSITELNSARRHFNENVSIVEADGFTSALEKTRGSKDWIILRNSGADRFIPRNFLMSFIPRRDFTAFMQKTADWTVMVPESKSEFILDEVSGDFDTYYTKMLGGLPLTQSKLAQMLPRSTEFAISLPTPQGDFREAYEHYLDAVVKLEKYDRKIEDLKEEYGKSPVVWEKELGIKEVAVIKWNNRSVSLVRTGKQVKDSGISQNPYRGFIPALYGSSFAINDDTCFVCSEGWMVFGGEEDLEAFLNCSHGLEGRSWPGKHARAVVLTPAFMFNWDKDGMHFNKITTK